MALLNTVANSAPIEAITKATRTKSVPSPGLPSQSAAEPATSRTPKAAIHGLRPPAATATAPRTRGNTALPKPAPPLAKPHRAPPLPPPPARAEGQAGPQQDGVARGTDRL